MIHITLADAIRFAEEAASEKPEGYVYINPDGDEAGEIGISCKYWDHEKDEPSCLVGQVLHKAGLDGGPMAYWKSSEKWISALSHSLRGAVEIDFDALDFLTRIQLRQDNGSTWRFSIASGKSAVSVASL